MERKMNTGRHSGLLLIIGGVCLLFGFLGSGRIFFNFIAMIGSVLFILYIPAVHAFQPGGLIGLVGIILVELAAVIALGFQIGLLSNSSLGDTLALASASAGMLGRLIIGWLTTRKKVFPTWVGWAFMTVGVIVLIGGVFHYAALPNLFSTVVVLLGVAALFGYGFTIYRRQQER
jgi:hypothetical protein